MFVRYLAHALEIAVLRRDNSRVHHDRLEDHTRNPPAVLSEEPLQRAEVVVGGDDRQLGDGAGYARPGGRAVGALGRPDLTFSVGRSEERRVGKECRSRWSAYHSKKKSKYLFMTSTILRSNIIVP